MLSMPRLRQGLDRKTRLAGDERSARRALLRRLGDVSVFISVLTLAMVSRRCCTLNWSLALVVLSPMPLLAFWRFAARSDLPLRSLADVTTVVQENVSGIRVVKSCSTSPSKNQFGGRAGGRPQRDDEPPGAGAFYIRG